MASARWLGATGLVACSSEERIVDWVVQDADGNVGVAPGGEGCDPRTDVDLFQSLVFEGGGQTTEHTRCEDAARVRAGKADVTLNLDYQDSGAVTVEGADLDDPVVFEVERLLAVQIFTPVEFDPRHQIQLDLRHSGDPPCTAPWDGAVWYPAGGAGFGNCETVTVTSDAWIAAVPFDTEWEVDVTLTVDGDVCIRDSVRLGGGQFASFDASCG